MIKGTFKRDSQGHLVSFALCGHAESGPYGQDIVCAAVSALAISTVNGIEALAGFAPEVVTDEKNGGYLAMSLLENINGEQLNISQILLENLVLGLQSVAETNGKFFSIKIHFR